MFFQPNWSNNTLKSGFFQISGKTGSRIRNFFCLKSLCNLDGANKRKFSQIGPAVPELLSLTQTDRQTDRQRSYYFRVRIFQVNYMMFVCLRVCLWPISSGTAGPIWLNFFLLALSWSQGGFRPKNSGSRIFWKFGKNMVFGVLFDQFG